MKIMEQLTKVFLTVFLSCVLIFLGVGITTATIDTMQANQYVSGVASEIEASNFAESVVDKYQSEASKIGKGYSLEVNPISSNGNYITAAQVVLKYDYTIPLLNATGKRHTAIAIAK